MGRKFVRSADEFTVLVLHTFSNQALYFIQNFIKYLDSVTDTEWTKFLY